MGIAPPDSGVGAVNAQSAVGAVTALFTPGAASAESQGRWVLLYGSRPRYLLLPKHTFGVQRRCVRVFRRGLAALTGEVALALHRLVPGRTPSLGFDGPAPAHAQWLADIPLEGLAYAAVQVGTPGPYQKATVLLLGKQGEPLGLAKVAMGAGADAMVEREGVWLRRARAIEGIALNVPRLFAHGSTGGGRRFVATDLGPTTNSASAFGREPRRFLTNLGQASARSGRFADSDARLRLQTALARLTPHTSGDVARTLASAMEDCDRLLRRWDGPTVIAHGDFTPWNARRSDAGLYVFDWEYAWEGASPAYDALHWLLLPKALRSSGLKVRALRTVQGTVRAYLDEAFSNQCWSHEVICGLTLHYLLDTILFYGMADGEINLDHPVNRHFYRMLEWRRQWMA